MTCRAHLWLILAISTLASAAAVAGSNSATPTAGEEQARDARGTRGRATSAARSAPVFDAETLALQVALDRMGFSSGEIDGRPGPNQKRALAAFQRANNLPVSDDLSAVRATLDEMMAGVTPLIEYVLTPEDVAGPFTPGIPADLMAQASFAALGYASTLEAIGERVHASPRLLRALNPAATFTAAGERVLVPNVIVEPPPAAAAERSTSATLSPNALPRPAVTVIVSKATSTLTVEDAGGRVLFHAPVTTGSRHDPLPIGTWKVTGVQRDPTFRYNPKLFWDADPRHSVAQLPPGPNNPVGVAWIDITKEHYGIHGTPEPSQVGHAQSHGCVRLTNWDVQRVLQWARTGTRVVFR